MNTSNNRNTDENFELEVKKAFKSFGLLFPTNDNEVELFESNFDVNKVKLPKELKNPMNILKKGYINSLDFEETPIINMNTVNEMKMAARKGEKIPKEILEKMREDRDKSKNGEK